MFDICSWLVFNLDRPYVQISAPPLSGFVPIFGGTSSHAFCKTWARCRQTRTNYFLWWESTCFGNTAASISARKCTKVEALCACRWGPKLRCTESLFANCFRLAEAQRVLGRHPCLHICAPVTNLLLGRTLLAAIQWNAIHSSAFLSCYLFSSIENGYFYWSSLFRFLEAGCWLCNTVYDFKFAMCACVRNWPGHCVVCCSAFDFLCSALSKGYNLMWSSSSFIFADGGLHESVCDGLFGSSKDIMFCLLRRWQECNWSEKRNEWKLLLLFIGILICKYALCAWCVNIGVVNVISKSRGPMLALILSSSHFTFVSSAKSM